MVKQITAQDKIDVAMLLRKVFQLTVRFISSQKVEMINKAEEPFTDKFQAPLELSRSYEKPAERFGFYQLLIVVSLADPSHIVA